MVMSDATLAMMRQQVLDRLPDTAVIQAFGSVSDGAGGWSENWAAVGTVACRVDPVRGDRQIELNALSERTHILYQLTVPYNAEVEAGRRVVVNDDTYDIVQISDEHSWNVSRRAIVNRIV